jgi:hypothetical protein
MSKFESADLILKLYDLRREATMRQARNWMFTYFPADADDYMRTMAEPEVGAYLRMVTSYWNMAAALVNHGAIDPEMFSDTVGEHVMVFAKIEPILGELREKMRNPDAFKHLETLILSSPNGKERLATTQEWLKTLTNKTTDAAA